MREVDGRSAPLVKLAVHVAGHVVSPEARGLEVGQHDAPAEGGERVPGLERGHVLATARAVCPLLGALRAPLHGMTVAACAAVEDALGAAVVGRAHGFMDCLVAPASVPTVLQ